MPPAPAAAASRGVSRCRPAWPSGAGGWFSANAAWHSRPEDAAIVSRIDSEAFETSTEKARPWIEPQLSAARFTVALAVHSDAPVGAATAIRTDGRAGPCVGIFGVGVIGTARGRGIGSAITSWLVARAFAAGAGLDVYTDL